MTEKDFWRKSKVAVIGGGSFGTVLAQLASLNCQEVRIWVRNEEHARVMNSTRVNKTYLPEMDLRSNITAFSEIERVFEGGVQAIIWALPSKVCRDEARKLAPFFQGDEILLHATKGIEEGSMKRISVVLKEELPCPRIGVMSGPNLAHEIAKGQPSATVVASAFEEVTQAGQWILNSEKFKIYPEKDVVGIEWAGTLKNILAIASGALDGLQLGWNSRALLITRGLAEMVRFGVAMGASQSTFLGLAGIGDVLATCSSSLSRNYRVGARLAQGEKLEEILSSLGSTAEGVRTTQSVFQFAQQRRIEMPITEGVYHLLQGEIPIQEILKTLMARQVTKN